MGVPAGAFFGRSSKLDVLEKASGLAKGVYSFLKRGLKVFLFYLALLCLFRIFFIFWMRDYMGSSTGMVDVWRGIVTGTGLSMQSAGVLTLVIMVPAGLVWIFSKKWSGRVQGVLDGVVLTILSILYGASFPYYRQFHSGFNQLMFNAVNDDMEALFWSLVQEFYLPVRLVFALFLAYVLWRVLRAFLRWSPPNLLNPFGISLARPLKIVWGFAVLWLTYIWALLVIYGGSLSWENAVDWENAGITKDPFINEAILDDMQAVYRGWRMNGRLLACNGLDFTTEQIRDLAAILSGKAPESDNLDFYLEKEAPGALIEKPKHIFVIISESYANWPLLPQYENLHISDGIRSVIAEDDSDYCPVFLPNGSSTVSAVTGVVTGFADANLYLTTMPEAFAEPYPTASAPVMKALGYDTEFWYAGPSTWERIGAFTTAQGYDHFYSRGDFGAEADGSVWGCDDEYLYEAVLSSINPDKPGFHVMLNVSNHSPYTVDVDSKGYDRETVRAALPEEEQDNEDLLKELGHYWYADREMGKFIKALKAKVPDCLIIVVGDHADRYNISKTPSTYERYGVPLVVTGPGVHKGLLLPDSAGSQIDIVPTIVDLIAPKGFKYHALGQSLARTNRRGVNYGFFVTRDYIGQADMPVLEPEAVKPESAGAPFDEPAMQNYINAIRSISWWRAKYGPVLDPALLEGRE